MFFGKFRSFIKDYFSFNTRERKGVFILLLIFIVNIIIRFYLNYFIPAADFNVEYIQLHESYLNTDVRKNDNISDKTGHQYGEAELKNLRTFDPNSVDENTLKEFGLTERQIRTFMNYRNKGGRFYKKEDLADIYGITVNQYRAMYPFIQIAVKQNKYDTVNRKITVSKKKKYSAFEKIEINSADSILLKKLPMIGSGRARMIVNYREALGGYNSVDQLLEVYTIDSLVFNRIRDMIYIDNTLIDKINLNANGIKHPYIKYTLARTIEAYRIQHGNFQHIEELLNLKIIDRELYNKLAPYLTIE